MSEFDLVSTVGGSTPSITSIINAMVRVGNLALEVGRAIGSAVYMVLFHKKC